MLEVCIHWEGIWSIWSRLNSIASLLSMHCQDSLLLLACCNADHLFAVEACNTLHLEHFSRALSQAMSSVVLLLLFNSRNCHNRSGRWLIPHQCKPESGHYQCKWQWGHSVCLDSVTFSLSLSLLPPSQPFTDSLALENKCNLWQRGKELPVKAALCLQPDVFIFSFSFFRPVAFLCFCRRNGVAIIMNNS